MARGKRPGSGGGFPSFLAASQPDALGFTRQRLLLTYLSHSEGAGRGGWRQLEAYGGRKGGVAASADSSK